MQQPFSAPLPSRAALAAVLFALAAAPALADKKQPAPLIGTNAVNVIQVSDLSGTAYFRGYRKNETTGNWDNITPNNPGWLFDGDLSTGVSYVGAAVGDAMILDFSPLLEAKPNHLMYVHDITVGFGVDNMRYSIYYSETDTLPGETNWVAVAESETAVGLKVYPVRERAKAVKYVFENSHSSNPLSEFQVSGYVSTVPKIVSKASLAKMYWSNGTMTANNGTEGFGGGWGIGSLFNGNFDDAVNIGPNGRLDNGGFCQLDFSPEATNGWFVTEIKTGNKTVGYPYSLHYSTNGTDWEDVDGGVNVNAIGQKTFPVNDTAVFVKCVFEKVGGWTAAFNELQVWGMDPDDVFCVHPSYTPWTPLEGSATCLKNGIDERFCTACGKRITRESSTVLMLGHNYTNIVEIPGRYRHYGRGSIECTRGDFKVDCPEPIDLITNKVNGEKIGGIKTPGLDHFTEVSVTSTGNTDWGVNPGHLIDGDWSWAWNKYWYSADDDPHVDYEFATELDLVYIYISLPNSTHVAKFYSVDDSKGEETELKGFLVKRTDIESGDKYHIWREPGSGEWEDVYGNGEIEFDELSVVKDVGIPARKHDEEGNEIPDNPNTDGDDGENNYNQYQRFTVRFYETRIRHLRIRQFKTDESAMKPMYVSELHPWGTVYGAGELRYRRETLMLLR